MNGQKRSLKVLQLHSLMEYSLRSKISVVLASRETTTGNYILKYINSYAK